MNRTDLSENAAEGRSNRWRGTAIRSVLYILGAYVMCAGMLAFLQRSLIYFPDRESQLAPEAAGLPEGQVHTVTLRTDDGLDLHGWHILPNGEIAADQDECDWQLSLGSPVVLYFSGNAGNRRYRTLECDIFTRLGCHVFLFDYRGYGDNAGSPSEERLAADAQAVWRYATEQRGVSPERIIVCGESLGGGVAVRLAADRCQAGTSPGALLLRSTFSSLADVASYHYPWLPVRWLMCDRYPAADQISNVTCPILHVHGLRDTIVPIQFGKKLFAAAPERAANGLPKRFVELAGADHNDILLVTEGEFRQAVGEFLDQLKSVRKPTPRP